MLLFPFIRPNDHAMALRMEMLKENLLLVQGKAMHEAVNIDVYFEGTNLCYEDVVLDLGMQCEGSVTFHANGNVDRAKTIVCKAKQRKGALVIQLGSGRMYVKK